MWWLNSRMQPLDTPCQSYAVRWSRAGGSKYPDRPGRDKAPAPRADFQFRLPCRQHRLDSGVWLASCSRSGSNVGQVSLRPITAEPWKLSASARPTPTA